MGTTHWVFLGLIAAAYVGMCVRIARRVGRTGRNPVAWFFITLVLTAIPAGVVLLRRGASQPRPASEREPAEERLRRCPHCGGFLDCLESGPGAGPGICPHCGMKTEKEHLA